MLAAAKTYGARGVEIDIDPDRIREAKENAKKAGVENLVRFEENDLFQANFREATVVTLFLFRTIIFETSPEAAPGPDPIQDSGAKHCVILFSSRWSAVDRRLLRRTKEVRVFKHRFTNHGRPDVPATKLQLSSAMPGFALSLQAYAFVDGGTALYLH